jgi:hypothetical protein
MTNAAVTLVLFALSAFAPTRPTGTVHFYRYLLTVGKAVHPTVSCDAFPIVKMQNGRIYTMKVPVGRHALTAGDSPTGIEVDVAEGKEYFVRIDYSPNAPFALRATLVLVPQEQGREETKKLRPLDGWFVEDAACGK